MAAYTSTKFAVRGLTQAAGKYAIYTRMRLSPLIRREDSPGVWASWHHCECIRTRTYRNEHAYVHSIFGWGTLSKNRCHSAKDIRLRHHQNQS